MVEESQGFSGFRPKVKVLNSDTGQKLWFNPELWDENTMPAALKALAEKIYKQTQTTVEDTRNEPGNNLWESTATEPCNECLNASGADQFGSMCGYCNGTGQRPLT